MDWLLMGAAAIGVLLSSNVVVAVIAGMVARRNARDENIIKQQNADTDEFRTLLQGFKDEAGIHATERTELRAAFAALRAEMGIERAERVRLETEVHRLQAAERECMALVTALVGRVTELLAQISVRGEHGRRAGD